jgi:pimeloyl-ACP methyl ester carboxylesterase
MIDTLRVETPDGVTGARIAGTSGPGLIFVHGVGSTAAIWDSQLDAFSRDFRCAAVELRGNGALAPDPDPASITREGFASDVLAVADALRFDRFTLIGCSLGGVVAFELWRRAPQRFDAMVIVGSFARYPDGDRYASGICDTLAEAPDMRAFAESRAARLGLPPHRHRETVEQMACKSITVPVLVLCGERDAIAPLVLSQEIAEGIPHARIGVIEDAGHVANADAPDAFNARLREFLSVVAT